MKRFSGCLALVIATLLAGGCASSSRREVVLADLMRDIDAQGEALAAPSNAGDRPDAPMTLVPNSASPAPANTATPAGTSMETAPAGNYMPLDLALGGGALTIQADSVLRITVGEDPGLSGSYPVNGLGGIQLGYIGPVILDNLTEDDAAKKISQILMSREFHTATVTVKILRPSYDQVRISGAVRRPGLIKIGAGDEVSLNNALNQVGGITDTPWRTKVKVVRGGLRSILSPYLPGEVYDLSDEKRNPQMPDVMLRNNDMVLVYSKVQQRNKGLPEEPRWVLVLGEVSQQGFYRFEPSERFTMMNLIFRMGDLPPYANDKAIRVIRADRDGIEQEFRVNVREIMEEGDPELDFPLQSGDRIIIPARRISLF